MFFLQRPAANATLSYLVGETQRAGANIVHVIDTHVHADHYSGGRELAQRVGAAYHLHECNLGRFGFNFSPLRDGQRLEAGNVEKRFNPMLSMSREASIAALTAEIPPQPADMARIVEAKLRGVVPAALSVCAA